MGKRAISVTLDADNLHWLEGQAVAVQARGVSELLDRLVLDARTSGRIAPGAARSVVGTIDLDPDDPGLERADAEVRALYEASIRRPILVRETPEPGRDNKTRRPARRG
jgi:hypothetical protein